MTDQIPMQAIIVPGVAQDRYQQSMRLALFGEDGEPLDISGGGDGGFTGMLDWQPWPLGSGGWVNYPDQFPADGFGYPCYAIYGEIVFLRGALYHPVGSNEHLGALPDAARPFHRQRLNLNQGQAFLSLDVRPTGMLVDGGGNPPPSGNLFLSGMYFLTETPAP